MNGDSQRLQAYLDGTLAAAERARLEEEASRSPELRHRLVAAHRARHAPQWQDLPGELRGTILALAERKQPPGTTAEAARSHAGRLTLAAASVIVAAGLGLWFGRSSRLPDGEPLRGAASTDSAAAGAAASLELRSPLPDARLSGRAVELSWTAVAGATGYEVFLLDSRGNIQATVDVTAPRYRLEHDAGSGSPPLERCWYVVARLADGGRTSSEARCWTLVDGG
jgi:hypothetical protein